MAVGKGSMERAAKAAGTDTEKNIKTKKALQTKAAAARTASEKAEKPAQKAPVVKKEAEEQIVYQKSRGILERDAMPNEQFGLGDPMPVYYF